MPAILPDNSVQVTPNKDSDLTAKKAGDLAAATVHLFTNDINPQPFTTLGDLTEAAFTGYAPIAIAGWTANDNEPDGSVSTTSTNVLAWAGPADPAEGTTVFGYYVLSAGAGTPLIYAARFTSPVSLADDTDDLRMVATFRIP